MRLLLVGAFAFPHVQGSQVYFQEQARALRAAGAEVELLTYGPGQGQASPGAFDGFVHTAIPAWAAPRSLRSGPQLRKPVADLALAHALRRASDLDAPREGSSAASSASSNSSSSTASKRASEQVSAAASWPRSSSRRLRHDAILVHHVEAALAALYALPRPRPPILYCAHTLLEHELPSYFKPLPYQEFPIDWVESAQARSERGIGSPTTPGEERTRRRSGGAASRALMASGRFLDSWVARRCDAWLALTQTSARVMAERSGRPGRLVWPPITDPTSPEPAHAGSAAAEAAIVRAHGLEPGRYFLYAGNLDPYQDLGLLSALAASRRHGLPIVVATHAERAGSLAPASTRPESDSETKADVGIGTGVAATPRPRPGHEPHPSGLRTLRIPTAAEARALTAHARATLVPRCTPGGFPIKLANSLAAGTPAVVFQAMEWGLEPGRDCLAGEIDRPVASFAAALERLERDPSLVERLRQGARAGYLARHTPARAAAETLALLEQVSAARGT